MDTAEPYVYVDHDTCVALILGRQCHHRPAFTVGSYPTCRRHVTHMLDVVSDRYPDPSHPVTVRRIP